MRCGKTVGVPCAAVAALVAILLSAPIASGGMRVVSWDPVTMYTDNTEIGPENRPVRYDVWYVDNVTGARTDIAINSAATSARFSDAGMVPGRLYLFFGKSTVQDGMASEDSPGHDWVRPYHHYRVQGGSISGGVMH